MSSRMRPLTTGRCHHWRSMPRRTMTGSACWLLTTRRLRRKEFPWCRYADAIIHVLSPNNEDIEALESFWKKRLIKDGLLKKAHSEEYWDDAYEFCLSKDMPGFHFHEKKVSKSYDLQMLCKEAYEHIICTKKYKSKPLKGKLLT